MSSKNGLVTVVAFLLVAVLGVTGFVLWKNRGEHVGFMQTISKACDRLTLADAQSMFGGTAKRSSATGVGDSEDTNLKTTNCDYVKPGATLADARTMSLSVRSAKTTDGAAINRAYFKPEKAKEFTAVTGLGDSAHWDDFTSRLYVLEGNDYYIVSGSDSIGGHMSLDELKSIAKLSEL